MVSLTYHAYWDVGTDVERIWPILTDLRILGDTMAEPEGTLKPVTDPESRYRIQGETQWHGYPLRWLEDPVEWGYLQDIRLRRAYKEGPLRTSTTRLLLKPQPSGTRIHLLWRAEAGTQFARDVLEPRFLDGLPRRWSRLMQHINAVNGYRADSSPLQGYASCTSTTRTLLHVLERRLEAGGIPHALARLIRERIESTSPHRRFALHPRRLAWEWHENEKLVYQALERGMRLGFLKQNWDVVCPSCGLVLHRHARLNAVRGTYLCAQCSKIVEARFDSNVVTSFSPATMLGLDVRRPPLRLGPLDRPHVRQSRIIPARAHIDLPHSPEENSHLLTIGAHETDVAFIAGQKAAPAGHENALIGIRAINGPTRHSSPSTDFQPCLRLENKTASPLLCLLGQPPLQGMLTVTELAERGDLSPIRIDAESSPRERPPQGVAA